MPDPVTAVDGRRRIGRNPAGGGILKRGAARVPWVPCLHFRPDEGTPVKEESVATLPLGEDWADEVLTFARLARR